MDSGEIEEVVATDVTTLERVEIIAPEASQSKLAISFRKKLNKPEQDSTSWENLCIYRVPRGLRDVNRKAYDPEILSIGPYHRGKKRLTDMDQHKWRCLRRVLERTNQDVSLYIDSIREIEKQARSCYDEPIDLNSDQFVGMMVLDGCFLLELIQGGGSDFVTLGYSLYDPVFSVSGPSWLPIIHDIFKLENQLPLFILDRLLELQMGNSYTKGLVIKSIVNMKGLNQLKCERLLNEIIESNNCRHCLDILRRSMLPPVDHNSQDRQKPRFIDFITKPGRALHLIRHRSRSSQHVNESPVKFIHCVTKLREAGIKLKNRDSNCVLDIKFEDGVLMMPRLLFDWNIQLDFRNLIAFEQCHRDCGKDITFYALFMDDLIDTPEDVGYLHNRGILDPFTGTYDEVADFFNSLCGHVTLPDDDGNLRKMSKKLTEQVNSYYNNELNNQCVNMKRTYFSKTWSIISLIAAIILLVLTFLQTFYGMYGYYRPK